MPVIGSILISLIFLGKAAFALDSAVNVFCWPLETDSYPLFAALKEGYFEKAGVKVNLVDLPQDIPGVPPGAAELNFPAQALETRRALIRDWLSSGKVDVIFPLAIDHVFKLLDEDKDSFKVFMFRVETARDYSTSIIVRNGSPVKSLKDLNGRNIGIETTNYYQYYLAKHFLKNYGIKNFRLIPLLTTVDERDYLLAGKVDAVFCRDPRVALFIKEGIARVLIRNPYNKLRFSFKSPVVNAAIISARYIKNNPEGARVFIRAMEKGRNFARGNRDKIIAILRDYIPPLLLSYSGCYLEKNINCANIFESAGIQIADLQVSAQVNKKMLQRMADLTYNEGYISKALDTEGIFFE